jgi:hypothetical protein
MTKSLSRSDTSIRRQSRWAVILMLVVMLPGCSLGVMFNKMILGDPKIKSQFRIATDVDLTKGEKSLMIICTAPHGTLSKHPSIHIDIVDRMSRELQVRKVKVINADDVATWLDDHGEWGDFSKLAEHFKADFVMHIELDTFGCEVPDSPTLMQGKTDGKVTVYRAGGEEFMSDSLRVAFERTFDVTYPAYPIPRESQSEVNFLEAFIDRTSTSLAQFVYDHRVSETVH